MAEHLYPRLFSPLSIGRLRLRNRIVAAPIDSKMGSIDGEITSRHIAYAVERARNDVGLIILDNMAVEWPRGKSGGTPIRLDEDRFVVSLGDLVEEVHTWGAAVVCQINHVGRQTNMRATAGKPLLSASEVAWPGSGTTPVAATREDIARVTDDYAQAARRVRQSGADGVEVHACHGYLLSSFLSPYTNVRDDEYGGSLENRARIVVEIVEAVRAQVGADFPVLVRINGRDYLEGGLTLEDAVEVAKLVEAAGADAIDVTAGFYESRASTFPGVAREQAAHADLSAAVKAAVSVPVITVGKIKDPETAEDVLREGRADLIALARTLIADPQWAAKARRGEADAIRPCIYTNRCRYRIQLGLRMRCDVNPDVGEAAPRNTQPLPAGTKALVVGGGPGGIEAALRLAKRRAHVTLVEREESLGGQLRFAGAVEFKRDLADYRDYLVRSLSRSDVDVVTGTEATLETVRAAGADIVVVATGSRPANGVPVAGDARVASALDVLAGRSVDGSVAVVGAGPTGCEIAALLSARGHDVTLVEQRGEIGGDITVDLLEYLRPILDANGVRVVTDCRVEAIEGDRVVTAGGRDELRADSVVLATGMEADDALVEALDDGRTPVYRIGDAREPGTLLSCTGDAARVVAAL